MIPARAIVFTESVITRWSVSNLYDSSSNASNFSPFLAHFTSIVGFDNLFKSKICVGCPISNNIKFDISTRLLILFCPADFK